MRLEPELTGGQSVNNKYLYCCVKRGLPIRDVTFVPGSWRCLSHTHAIILLHLWPISSLAALRIYASAICVCALLY